MGKRKRDAGTPTLCDFHRCLVGIDSLPQEDWVVIRNGTNEIPLEVPPEVAQLAEAYDRVHAAQFTHKRWWLGLPEAVSWYYDKTFHALTLLEGSCPFHDSKCYGQESAHCVSPYRSLFKNFARVTNGSQSRITTTKNSLALRLAWTMCALALDLEHRHSEYCLRMPVFGRRIHDQMEPWIRQQCTASGCELSWLHRRMTALVDFDYDKYLQRFGKLTFMWLAEDAIALGDLALV
jgi:hypothetical protein